jgi:hypothetical protein
MTRKDNRKIARQFVEKDARRAGRRFRELGIPSETFAFADPLPALENGGEGTMISLVIGTRDKLTGAQARAAADKYREVVDRYPKAIICVSLLGYDEDPRELVHIEDVARYIRRFAQFAGINDFEAALGGPLGEMGTALLAACGVFGEDIKRTIKVPSPPTAQ